MKSQSQLSTRPTQIFRYANAIWYRVLATPSAAAIQTAPWASTQILSNGINHNNAPMKHMKVRSRPCGHLPNASRLTRPNSNSIRTVDFRPIILHSWTSSVFITAVHLMWASSTKQMPQSQPPWSSDKLKKHEQALYGCLHSLKETPIRVLKNITLVIKWDRKSK
jgi:hypothetical protein